MPRAIYRLSAKEVQNKRKPGYFCDGGGLYLQVSPALTKSWIFRYTLNKRSREMGLGSAADITLEEARERAAEQRKLLTQNVDPIEVRDAQNVQKALEKARTITFHECCKRYIKTHKANWKNAKHASQWTNTLETYCGPVFGSMPVQDVDTGLVLQALEPLWTEKHETASRLRSRIKAVLDWAKVRGFRTGENPARWVGHLDKSLPKIKKKKRVRHHPALPYEEIGGFMAKLRQQEGEAARALEFLILTAARTGEVIGAKPEEINAKKAVWTVPADRMKAERAHRVPLSPRALELVKGRKGDYLFPGQNPGAPLSNMAMLMLLKRMGYENLTVHGFRSTFRDWAAERTNYPREVCEMALAHVVGDDVEAAYRRGDLFEKRQRLMAEWAKFCDRKQVRGTITPLRRAG